MDIFNYERVLNMRRTIIITIWMLLVLSLTVNAAMTESEFLNIVCNEDEDVIHEALLENAEELGIDVSLYNVLDSKYQDRVLRYICGSEYEDIEDFKSDFQARTKKVYKDSQNSGSHSGGGGTQSSNFKGSFERDDGTFIVTPEGISDGNVVIMICYYDNTMVYFDKAVYREGQSFSFTPSVEYNSHKVTIWESLSSLKPVSECGSFD